MQRSTQRLYTHRFTFSFSQKGMAVKFMCACSVEKVVGWKMRRREALLVASRHGLQRAAAGAFQPPCDRVWPWAAHRSCSSMLNVMRCRIHGACESVEEYRKWRLVRGKPPQANRPPQRTRSHEDVLEIWEMPASAKSSAEPWIPLVPIKSFSCNARILICIGPLSTT